MYCHLGRDIHQLRQKSRDLLHQLESNSVLLESKLKKLRNTARTSKCSDKSQEDILPSTLKRKYKSWKARNTSGNVAAAMNSSVSHASTDDSGETKSGALSKTNKVKQCVKSPAKRTKHTLITTPGAKKYSKPTFRPWKVNSKQRNIQKRKKPCKECYCPDIYVETGSSDEATETQHLMSLGTHDDGTEVEIHCLCRLTNSEEEEEENTSSRMGIPSFPAHTNRKGHPVEAGSPPCSLGIFHGVQPCLTYSPQSLFLRRLKKRAQLLEQNFNGNQESTGKTSHSKTTQTSYHGETSSSLEEAKENNPRNSEKMHSAKRTNTDTRGTQTMHEHQCDTKERAEVCQCGRTPQSIPPNKCCCSQRFAGYDVISGLVENGMEHPCLNRSDRSSWFDELSRFRHKNWFDCHAHLQSSVATNDNELRGGWLDEDFIRNEHKCLHRYIINERLFLEPVYADHRNVSRCTECHLPRISSGKIPKRQLEVTLPSKRRDPEVAVTVPTTVTTKATSGVTTSAPAKKTMSLLTSGYSGPIRQKPPVPTNSLALRYQRGVI